MEYDILRIVMESFSKENTRLREELSQLQREIALLRAKQDDRLIAEIMREVPHSTSPEPVMDPLKAVQPSSIPMNQMLLPLAIPNTHHTAKRGRPRLYQTEEERKEAIKMKQREYRQKKQETVGASSS